MASAQSDARLYAAIEGGGTKVLCAVGTGPDSIWRKVRLSTRDAETTLAETAAFLTHARADFGPLAGLGVAFFGPLCVDPAAPRYGQLFATTKPGWDRADVLGPLQRAAGCPARIETDVNAAALAEAARGEGRGCGSLAYITVGTGIGVGMVVEGQPVHGAMHPEGGHMRLRRHPRDLGFSGICSFHGDCCEGLASGPAIAARSGAPAEGLPPDHPDWAIVADTLGQLCGNIALLLSPQRIVLGGGVMTNAALLPVVRQVAERTIAGYIPPLNEAAAMDRYIVAPDLIDPGLIGAFLLAQRAANVP